jgi:hypothetical protein
MFVHFIDKRLLSRGSVGIPKDFLSRPVALMICMRLSEKKQFICARTDDPVAIAGKRKRQTFDGASPRLD